MCGISGFSLKSPAQPGQGDHFLATMEAHLRHRGPDASGRIVVGNGTVGLGHTRLAIIDLNPVSNQPMRRGELAITFNGEIYNYLELRRELQGEGLEFSTQSDTEVILGAYQRWGMDFLGRLRGMYAFALWDGKIGTLVCARDKMGKKPFVYGFGERGFFFASTIPALLSLGIFPRGYDPRGLAYYSLRHFRHIPDPFTLYQSLKKLEPGHFLMVNHGVPGMVTPHWIPRFSPRSPSTRRVRAELERAVRWRLRADVPVAALFSGGVDSSAIVAIARREQPSLPLFHLAMSPADEELSRARALATHWKMGLREYFFNREEQESILRRILELHGEPIALGPLAFGATLCREIRRAGFKAALAGIGADEIFYGYDGGWRQFWASHLLPMVFRLSPPFWRQVERIFPPQSLGGVLASMAREPVANWKQLFYDRANAGDPGHRAAGALAPILKKWGQFSGLGRYIDIANFISLISENAHSIALSADIPGMAFGVELRCPFLDQDLIDYAFGLPAWSKVSLIPGNRFNKKLLKRAMASRVPRSILYSPKKGFGNAIDPHFNSDRLYRLNRGIFSLPD